MFLDNKEISLTREKVRELAINRDKRDDFLGLTAIERRKNEETIPWEEVKWQLKYD